MLLSVYVNRFSISRMRYFYTVQCKCQCLGNVLLLIPYHCIVNLVKSVIRHLHGQDDHQQNHQPRIIICQLWSYLHTVLMTGQGTALYYTGESTVIHLPVYWDTLSSAVESTGLCILHYTVQWISTLASSLQGTGQFTSIHSQFHSDIHSKQWS